MIYAITLCIPIVDSSIKIEEIEAGDRTGRNKQKTRSHLKKKAYASLRFQDLDRAEFFLDVNIMQQLWQAIFLLPT